jgi:hypothetical protein
MTPSVSVMTGVSPSVEVKVKARYFDLEKFEKCSAEKTVTFVPLSNDASMEQILASVGNDRAELVSRLNVGNRRILISETKKAIAVENGGVNAASIGKFVATFKMLPKFAKLGPAESDSAEVRTAKRKQQTQAVFAFIKSNPILLAELKEMSMEPSTEADEDDDENADADEA